MMARHNVLPIRQLPVIAMQLGAWGFILTLSTAPALAASCQSDAQQFALLATMGLQDEAVKAWKALPASCRQTLNKSGATPPKTSDPAAIVAYGSRLHAQRKQAHRSKLQQPLGNVDIPDIDQNALAGLGPADTSRAIGGMIMELAATGLESRQRLKQADAVRNLGDLVRGDEKNWIREPVPPGSSPISGGPAGSLPPVPDIPLPETIQNASCDGDFSFLAPAMHDYPDPLLRNVRQDILTTSVQTRLAAIRAQASDVDQAIRILTTDVQNINIAAAEAKAMADASDGRGVAVGSREVEQNSLTMALNCGTEPSIHADGLCGYITMRYNSLVLRAIIELVKRCGL